MRSLFIASALFLSALENLENQDQEKAFRTFLAALDGAKREPIIEQEQKLYQEALTLYLDHVPPAQLVEQFGKAAERDLELRLIVALAYANLGRYDAFFRQFYPAYCAYPDHYLSYKTKAILHIKLYERCRTVEEREKERAAIVPLIHKAVEGNGSDIALYKLWLLFAPEEIEACLNKIMSGSMMVARSDLPFFIQAALDAKRFDLGKRLIAKGRSWYPYSRSLDDFQHILDETQ